MFSLGMSSFNFSTFYQFASLIKEYWFLFIWVLDRYSYYVIKILKKVFFFFFNYWKKKERKFNKFLKPKLM